MPDHSGKKGYLTPENLPKFISKLEFSLSAFTQNKPSTSKSIESNSTPKKSWHPFRKPKALKCIGVYVSSWKIQLKNCYWALEDEKLMEWGICHYPLLLHTRAFAKNLPLVPKPQRSKPHK